MPALEGFRNASVGWMALCVGLLGCGKDAPYQASIGGTVLYQDGTEPRELEGASLEFETSATTPPAQVPLTADGSFALEARLSSGPHRVRIVPLKGKQGSLDPKYQSFDTSGLTFTAPSKEAVTFKIQKRK